MLRCMGCKRLLESIKTHWLYWLCLGGLASVFLFLCVFPRLVSDTAFHLMRIESLAIHFLDNGTYPCRLYEAAVSGYGYAAPLFYCDLTLVPFALLRCLGLPLTCCYSALLLTGLFLSFGIMLKASQWFGCTRKESIVCALFYVIAPSFVMALFQYGQMGNVYATAFLPLVVFPMLTFLFKEHISSYQLNQATLLLIIGASFILLTHIVSTFVVALLLGILCLLRVRFLFLHRERLVRLMIATCFILGLTLWFWLPLIEQKMAVDLWCFERQTLTLADMWCRGIELFVPWRLFSTLFVSSIPNLPNISEDVFTLWGWFLVPLSVIVFRKRRSLCWKTAPLLVKFTLVLILITVICLTTKPTLYLLMQVMGWIQFPSRFWGVLSCLAAPLMACFVCQKCNAKERQILFVALTVASLLGCGYAFTFKSRGIVVDAAYSLPVLFNVGLYEYVPRDYLQSGGTTRMEWTVFPQRGQYGHYETEIIDSQGPVIIPRFYYKGYVATLNDTPCDVNPSCDGLVEVDTKAQCGSLRVHYAGTPLQAYSSLGSLIFLFILIVCVFVYRHPSSHLHV